MAVTKRLRYEVLRRDDYTCRYCGAKAPHVKLTVDHVVPQALGGPDEPGNLVAACEACNGGKTSVPPDAALVADVECDALRWSAAMQKAAEIAHADYEARLAYRRVFRDEWDDWKTGAEGAKQAVPLDAGWESSLDNFREAGLPDWELGEAVRAAMANQKVAADNTFRYFAGICWTKIRKMHETARALLSGQASEVADVANDPRIVHDASDGRFYSCVEATALLIWDAAWKQHHDDQNPPTGLIESADAAIRSGFVRQHLRGKRWRNISTVLEAIRVAGAVGLTDLEEALQGLGERPATVPQPRLSLEEQQITHLADTAECGAHVLLVIWTAAWHKRTGGAADPERLQRFAEMLDAESLATDILRDPSRWHRFHDLAVATYEAGLAGYSIPDAFMLLSHETPATQPSPRALSMAEEELVGDAVLHWENSWTLASGSFTPEAGPLRGPGPSREQLTQFRDSVEALILAGCDQATDFALAGEAAGSEFSLDIFPHRHTKPPGMSSAPSERI